MIAASDIEVDDQKKVARLRDPSIINGAQSQGEIRLWSRRPTAKRCLRPMRNRPSTSGPETIVDPDSTEVVETAIARNTATPVKSISQAGGSRGHLDDLEASVQKRFPSMPARDLVDLRKQHEGLGEQSPDKEEGQESSAHGASGRMAEDRRFYSLQ